MTTRLILTMLLLASANAGLAQEAPPQPAPAPGPAVPDAEVAGEADDPAADDVQEIVVTGTRVRGGVLGDIPPEISLDRRQIRGYGASNLADLLAALAPQTQSGRGRGEGGPVVLLDGRRISGFGEIRDIPPEAIERVDILAEEVALKYGYRADQRVVNFVLRRRFRALTAEIAGGAPTAGGRTSSQIDLDMLRIDRAGRWSLDAKYSRDTALLESERDITPRPGVTIDVAPFRTLLPQVDRLQLSGTLNRTVFTGVSTTLNARFDATDTNSLFGLSTASLLGGDLSNPLARDGKTRNGHIGLSMNGDLQPWRWSLTANLDRNASRSRTDADIPNLLDGSDRIVDRARSVDQSADTELVANGPLFQLPAGPVTTSLKLGAFTRDFSSDAFRATGVQSTDLSRDRVDGQASVDIPLTSRRDDVLAFVGDFSANVNYAADRLSDFGTLTTLGYGLNWSPIREVRVIASATREDGAPSVQQLGDAVIETPNARVFDFSRAETVDVTRLDGGNAALVADNRRVMKLGLTVQPLKDTELTLRADYTNSRTRNGIAGFPALTPEIEAAFPDRFTRGSDGRLLRIDARPVNFARSDREELRYGINFSKPLGRPDPSRADLRAARGGRRDGAGGAVPPTGNADGARGPGTRGASAQGTDGPGRGGFGRGGGGFGGFGGRGQGSLQLALFHTWRFTDTILIRDGVPELDLLGGSAVGNRGGRPRHEVEVQAGVFKRGLGGRLTASYQSGTRVTGLADPGDDLRFGSFSTVNLRLFADLGAQEKLVARHPWMRGARVSLLVDNLLDTRLRVRDATGATPFGYQGDLLDPLGRSVRISLRKLFLPMRRRRPVTQ